MTLEAKKYQNIGTRFQNWWKAKWKEWNTEKYTYEHIAYWREFQYAESEWYGRYFRNLSSPDPLTLRPYVVGFSPLRFYLPQADTIAAVEIAIALKPHFKLSTAVRYDTRDRDGVSWRIRVVNGYDIHDAYAKQRGEFGIGIGESADGQTYAIIFPAQYDHLLGYSAKQALNIKKRELRRHGDYDGALKLEIDPRGNFPAATPGTVAPITLAEFSVGLPRDPEAHVRRFNYNATNYGGYWAALPLSNT